MDFGTLSHNQNNLNSYQGRSNEFGIGATVWNHRMYKREHRRVGVYGGMLTRRNVEKSVQFADYFSCSLFLVQKA